MAEGRLMTDEERAQTRRWLETWARVGPILEDERWRRLHSMSDDEIDRDVLLVVGLWQPDWHGDDGDELLRHQEVFAKARRTGRG